MAKHIHVHLHRGKAKDSDSYGSVYEFVQAMKEKYGPSVTFRAEPAGMCAYVAGVRRAVMQSTKPNDAGFTKYDPREVRKLDERIADLEVEARSESGERRQKTLEEIAALKRERAKYHADDAYRGTFTVEVDEDRYDAFSPGRVVNWMGQNAKVLKRTLTEKKKSSTGELIPAKLLIQMETVDCKATDSKLEDLEKQLDEIETQIEKLEDTGQAPSRAQLDKRKQIQGAIAVIKSATKKAAE